jgi:hypothetical protein
MALVGRVAELAEIDHLLARGGPQALELLALLAGRLVVGATAVVATSSVPLGIGQELRLSGLSEDELAVVVGDVRDDVREAVWVASRGQPGAARSFVAQLAGLPEDRDPLVHLALHARSTAQFLDVDVALVRLLEAAMDRAPTDGDRARLMARLARELLGDASAGARRRTLVDGALSLARRCGDRQVLAEVLDARLHALWDATAAEERLAAASEIIDLARAAADDTGERRGLFWRFVALMELGRVAEAESALAALERAAAVAGDAEGQVMATARHAMLATLRGRFDEASRLTAEVGERGRQVGMADTAALVGTLHGAIAGVREDLSAIQGAVEELYAGARRVPGQLYEAQAARVLAMLGRTAEAAAELDRLLPLALAGSGPRWFGGDGRLAVVAATTGNRAAAARLYDLLLPYRGRLVIFGGANTVTGPVSHYQGLLATQLEALDDGVRHFQEAIALEERIGALPWLAHSLAGCAEALTLRRRDGDDAQASDSWRRARLLAERLGMTGLLSRLVPPAGGVDVAARRDGLAAAVRRRPGPRLGLSRRLADDGANFPHRAAAAVGPGPRFGNQPAHAGACPQLLAGAAGHPAGAAQHNRGRRDGPAARCRRPVPADHRRAAPAGAGQLDPRCAAAGDRRGLAPQRSLPAPGLPRPLRQEAGRHRGMALVSSSSVVRLLAGAAGRHWSPRLPRERQRAWRP